MSLSSAPRRDPQILSAKAKAGCPEDKRGQPWERGMTHFAFPLCILLKTRSAEVLGEGDLLPGSAGSFELQGMAFDHQVPH